MFKEITSRAWLAIGSVTVSIWLGVVTATLVTGPRGTASAQPPPPTARPTSLITVRQFGEAPFPTSTRALPTSTSRSTPVPIVEPQNNPTPADAPRRSDAFGASTSSDAVFQLAPPLPATPVTAPTITGAPAPETATAQPAPTEVIPATATIGPENTATATATTPPPMPTPMAPRRIAEAALFAPTASATPRATAAPPTPTLASTATSTSVAFTQRTTFPSPFDPGNAPMSVTNSQPIQPGPGAQPQGWYPGQPGQPAPPPMLPPRSSR